MKPTFILCTLFICICAKGFGQENNRGGIVYGPKAAFNISTPQGWVLDNQAGRDQGLPCVLYPKGSSWSDAKTVMYAKIASTQFEDVNAFVAEAIKDMQATRGAPKEKIASGKTGDGHDYFINEYRATKSYSQWERVAYVQLPRAVAYIVLSSQDETSYRKDAAALEKVLKTLVYVEPKSESKAPVLEGVLANGQDYAARFQELQSQKAADAQIDSLLDEWRAQRHDDPDAWITSANYYFNKSVGPMISTKKAEKGDYSLTDKKTGKASGSITFKPNVVRTSRQATDLLEEATTKFPDRLGIWCGLAFIYQESGDFDRELSTLRNMVAYAREHPTQLKWEGKPLSEPADKFVPGKLHSYGLYYAKKENPEDDKRWFQISTLAMQQYPNHPEGFNDAAGYYADLGDWQNARELFGKAHEIDPKSVGVLINLGNVSIEIKDFVGARKYYEEALKLEPNGQYAQEAKEGLRKLKKK